MKSTWPRRLLAALAHQGPGYNLAATREADLRATLTDLATRWEASADFLTKDLPADLFIEPDSSNEWAATRAHGYRVAASDLRDVLRTGHVPHGLMTDAELEQHGTPEEAGR